MTPPLILIPGLGSDRAVWQPTIDVLGDAADCTVGDTLADDSLSGMAARILAAAPDRFALAGVSMGGMVALEIMRLAPERVMRLALVDTSWRWSTPTAGPTPLTTVAGDSRRAPPSPPPPTIARWRRAVLGISSTPTPRPKFARR